jgi:hypothetical protein
MRKKINLKQYSCEIIFIVSDQIVKETNRILKQNKINNRIDYAIEGIFLYHDIDKYYVLLDKNSMSHNTIAHELYHASVRITEDRDISDEESQAWLCGHLSANMYKFLDKNKIKIKYE